MARFDIHRRLDSPGCLLDLQANILRDVNTRFVAPLRISNNASQLDTFLNDSERQKNRRTD
jgi:toxin CcdB